jgi:hypothetical protein
VVNEYKNTTSEKEIYLLKCVIAKPFARKKNGKRFGTKLNIVGENAKETKGLIWFRNDLRVHDNESYLMLL